MDLGLNNKVAVVTGASKGLGKAVAYALSQEGCKVGICSRNEEAISRAAKEISSATGNRVFGYMADVTNNSDIESFFKDVESNIGVPEIVVINAGGPPASTFESTTEEMWVEGFELTLRSAIRIAGRAIPGQKKLNQGRLLFIASLSTKEPIDGLALSNIIRPGILGLSKTLSKELAPYNITANAVCPGFIATERLLELSTKWATDKNVTQQEVLDSFSERIPLKRLGTPEEFADMVLFLASERARYITGSVVQVDGGRYSGLY